MQELRASGKVRAIGVSNFTIAHLKELIDDPETHIIPAVNQVEFHPLLFSVQRPLLEFCREHGIVLQAYAPLGSTDGVSQVLNHPTLTAIATKHRVTAAEVALRWALNHGVSVIPKSSDPQRIRANAAPSLLTGQHQPQMSSDQEKIGQPDDGVPGGSIAPILSGACDWVLSSDEMEALNEISGSSANVASDVAAKRFCWDPTGIV
jgi:diketogulonate reductase-like aldo/keto reductase